MTAISNLALLALLALLTPLGFSLACGADSSPGSGQGGGGEAGVAGDPSGNGAGTAGTAGKVEQPCSLDSDCQLYADYCAGCDCVVVSKMSSQPRPGTECDPGTQSMCIVNPCQSETAQCSAGQCKALAVP